MRIETFKPEHLASMTPREPDASQAGCLKDYIAAATLYSENGPAFTGFINDIPIAVAGIMIPWPGLGTAWSFTTALVALYPFAFHRGIKHKIEEIAVEKKLRRVQMDIPVSHVVSHRWALRLGFQVEGAMPSYGPDGESWIRFSRLFERPE